MVRSEPTPVSPLQLPKGKPVLRAIQMPCIAPFLLTSLCMVHQRGSIVKVAGLTWSAGQVECGVEVAGKSGASITAVFRLESFAKGLSSCSCCQWGFPNETFRRSWGDRFGKARVFIDGHEVMVKRYSFLQQLTFSHDAYHLNVDNTALGPLHGCSIHIRVAAQMGLHLAVRLLLPCPDHKEVEC